jgi:hypothetical protein
MNDPKEFGIGRRIDLTIDGKNVVAELYTKQNKELVSITSICDAIGIDSRSQRAKLKSDPKFTPGDITLPSNGGKQLSVALPVEEVGLWLCGINTKRVKKDIAPILFAFQKHCQVELHAAITGKAGTARVEALEKQNIEMSKQISTLVEALADVKNELIRVNMTLEPMARVEKHVASIGGKFMAIARGTKKMRDGLAH